MYRIIGSDGKEYGPVTAEQLRQWVAEGRINALTKVQAEGETEWKALAEWVEFHDVFAPARIPAGPPTLDIGMCVSRSWDLFKKHWTLLLGATILVGLILGGVGIALRLGVNLACGMRLHDFTRARGFQSLRLQLPGILASNFWFWLMTGPFVGGLYNLFLKLIRGQPADVGDAFAGFGPQFGQLALGSFVVAILTTIGCLFCLVPGIYLGVCWKFTLPAIIDRRLGFWQGMETSRHAVTGRWWLVFALLLVTGLIAGAGVLACCVGILVTAPIAIGAIAYAYEDILGRGPTQTA